MRTYLKCLKRAFIFINILTTACIIQQICKYVHFAKSDNNNNKKALTFPKIQIQNGEQEC